MESMEPDQAFRIWTVKLGAVRFPTGRELETYRNRYPLPLVGRIALALVIRHIQDTTVVR